MLTIVSDGLDKRKAKRSRVERYPNPFGASGGVYFEETEDGRHIPHVILPRIMKTDVRRTYAQMFANVYNSCDNIFMTDYLRTFYRTDFTFHQHFSDELLSRNKTNCELSDLQRVGAFWYEKMTSSPDLRFDLGQAQVRARSDGTGMVQFQFCLDGTFMVPDELCHDSMTAADDLSRAFDHDRARTSSSDDQERRMLQDVLDEEEDMDIVPAQQWTQDVVTSVRLLKEIDFAIYGRVCDPQFNKWLHYSGPMTAVKYHFNGTASMHLDANLMIYCLNFNGY